MSGALDNMPEMLDEHVQTVSGWKQKVVDQAQKFRQGCRETLKKDKVPALGFATGAFIGMVG